MIVKFPKKGDSTVRGNWRGITLMSTAAKAMGKGIITRIRESVAQHLRVEQAGYIEVAEVPPNRYLCYAI